MQIKQMIKHFGLILTLLLPIHCDNLLTEENGTEEKTSTIGQIRFIHNASSTAELDMVYLDPSDNYYHVFQYGATYGNQYGYFDFYTGNREIFAYTTNNNIVVAIATVSLKVDEKYTLIAVDYEATIDPELLVVPDTLALPEEGFAFVRFIHAGADGEQIHIMEQDSSTTISTLSHLAHSKYMKLPARTYKFEVKSDLSQQTLLKVEPITFLSGHCYSVIFSGTTTDITSVDFNAQVYRETSL